VDTNTARTGRALQFEPTMSPAEAVMWKVSADPWLRPIAGSLALVDRPIDADRFRRRVRAAVADIARLRERVAAGPAPWDPPEWVPDEDFDFDYHLRHVGLAGGGSLLELHEVVSRWYEDPFDPMRPLWQFVMVDGVEGDKGALFCKLHHSISDGIGLMRLSERYLDLERDSAPSPEVDLSRIVAEAAAAGSGPAGSGGLAHSTLGSPLQLASRVAHLAGWPMGIARQVVGEAAAALLDPRRAIDTAGQVVGRVRGAAAEVHDQSPAGSPLWTARSARRHLESVRVPLAEVKRTGVALGGSVNDVFVTGAVNAAVAYHRLFGADLEVVRFSFVVSQRQGGGVGGNFFTPVRVQLALPPASPGERLAQVRDAMAGRRESLQKGSSAASLSNLAGLAQMLPASVLSRVARSQILGVDFATSNLRGAPVPLYVSGARVLHTTALGPLAGTPFNLTTLSYDGSLDMGLLVDPVAVADPAGLRDCLEDAYRELIDTAG
jgi:diacylglycerol O-acyltransferase